MFFCFCYTQQHPNRESAHLSPSLRSTHRLLRKSHNQCQLVPHCWVTVRHFPVYHPPPLLSSCFRPLHLKASAPFFLWQQMIMLEPSQRSSRPLHLKLPRLMCTSIDSFFLPSFWSISHLMSPQRPHFRLSPFR